MPEFLFAYGTLQPELARPEMAAIVSRMEPVGTGWVRGVLFDFGSYPGAVLDAESQRRIWGTVLRLPADTAFLKDLDDYEEYDPAAAELSQYVRAPQAVEMADGTTLDCWIYVYNRPTRGSRVVESGRYGG